MSLGKLLATGRSLVGGAPGEGRYNLSRRNQLPKFNEAQNPFAQPAPAEAKLAAPVTALVPQSEAATAAAGSTQSPQPTPHIAHQQTQRIPELADQPIVQGTLLQVILSHLKPVVMIATGYGKAAVAKAAALGKKLMARFGRKEPKSMIPRFGKRAVQTELSLDNVKVVRNDLEESDLEIVVAETVTSTQVAPQAPAAAPNRGPVPEALKKLTGRIIGGGRT